MNDTDGQNIECTDDEEIWITDLDAPDSPQHKRAARIISLTRKSLTTPWIRSGLYGIVILILLGVFFQWLRSTPATPNTPGVPAPYVLNTTNSQGLIFIQSSNYTLAAYQAATGRILWHTSLPAAATLEAVHQTLYVYFVTTSSKTELEALNVNTGKVIWHDALPAAFTYEPEEVPGTQTSPAFFWFLDNNALYIQDISGLISAIDASTGQIKWTHQTNNPSNQSRGFQVQNGMIEFVAANATTHILNASTGQDIVDLPARYRLLPTIDGNMIYALPPPSVSPIQVFHAPDGQQLWAYPLPDGTWAQTEINGVVYLGAAAGATLIALRGSDGHRLWTYQASDGQPMVSTFFAENSVGYLLQQDATLVSIRISDGSVLWRTHIPELQHQVSTSTTYFLDQGTLLLFNSDSTTSTQPMLTYALRASDGQILWHNAQILTYPLLLAGVLYTMQNNGQLDAWRESDGHHLWGYSTPVGTRIIGKFLPSSPLLFLLSRTGMLSTLRTNDGKLLWRYP